MSKQAISGRAGSSILEPAEQRRALAVVAAAAPVTDRLRGRGFTAARTSRHVLRSRTEAMAEAFGRGDKSAVTSVLQALNWRADHLLAMMSDVYLSDPVDAPEWVTGFLRFLELSALVDPATEVRGPVDQLAMALHTVGRCAAVRLTNGQRVQIAKHVTPDLGAQLAGRLLAGLTPAIDFELGVAAVVRSLLPAAGPPPLDITVDGWLTRCELLPGVSYVLGTTFVQWERSTEVMLARLVRDWPQVRERFGFQSTYPVLVGMRGDLGDLHQGGQSTALLHLDEGTLVYKPKDLRVNQLLRYLEIEAARDAVIPVPFDRRELLREHYGWETYAEPGACHDASEVTQFYRRAGGLLRLLEFLEGRDLWLDNLIAAGPYPLFIDLEALLYGMRVPVAGHGPAARHVQSLLEESSAYTGVPVAATILAPGYRAEDMGALTPPRTMRLPYRPALAALQAQRRAIELDPAGFVTIAPPPYAATLNGRPQTVTQHVSTLLAGYRRVDAWLAARGCELVDRFETRYDVANVTVRHIHRDTWSYARAIQQTVSPAALRGGIERDISVWQAIAPAAEHTPRIAARIRVAEVAAIRQLNIPLFRTRPGSRDLLLDDGSVVPDVIEVSALARLRARARDDPMPVAQRIDVLMSSLSTGAGGRRPRRVSVAGDAGTVGEDRALAFASAVGDFVLANAVRKDTDIAWAGLAYDPKHDLETLRVLDDDLMTGTCGIALFLADLFRVTRTARYRQGALDALRGTIARGARASGSSMGGFVGPGALRYVLARCRAALADELPPPSDVPLPEVAAGYTHPMDLIAGPAGTVLVHADTNGIAAWWARVLATGEHANPYPREATRLRVLPGYAAAEGLVRHRLGQPWPAARSRGVPRRPGNSLALVTCRDPRTPQIIARLVRTPAHARRCTSARLLDDLEIALATRGGGDTPMASDAAQVIAAQLAWRWECNGRGFPERLASPRHDLSLLWGIPAVAHAVLRHAVAADLRSPRLLA